DCSGARAVAEAILEIEGLTKRFGGVLASDGISLALPRGELHALIGPNGAGKTTLIGQLTGEIAPDEGRIRFDARDVTALPVYRRSQLGLARSFQIASLFAEFTALDNVALAVGRGACGSRPMTRSCAPASRRARTWRSPISAMASAASLKSPWRWRPGRACCCSMNRWPAWARKNPRGWWRCCDNSRAASPPFFWSSTIWTRSSRWRIASASWCTAASSPPASRPRSVPMPRYARPISASRTRFGRRLGMADAPLLELRDVETSYGLSRVLFGVSLAVAPGEVVSLMGRNGMGKTTTVLSIMGLTPPASGSIRFAGGEIRHLPAYRVAQLGIGLVPEGRQLFPNLTTRENLVATASNRGGATEPWTLERVFALFPGLAERAGSMANLLSGGEQ